MGYDWQSLTVTLVAEDASDLLSLRATWQRLEGLLLLTLPYNLLLPFGMLELAALIKPQL